MGPEWRYPSPRMRALAPGWRNPGMLWWAAVDSNHLPPRYQHGALPVELAAHGLGKGLPGANRANRDSTMARIRARKQRRPDGRSSVRPRPLPRRLHRRERFVDRDLRPSRPQDGAGLGQLDRLAERVSLQDRVAARRRAPVVHRSIVRD